jgi:hypothetical protein
VFLSNYERNEVIYMKKFYATVLTMVLAIMAVNLTSSVKAQAISDEEIISEICIKANEIESEVFGYNEDEFDLNCDGNLNVSDLIILKQRYLNGESGVTENTVHKFARFLTGSDEKLEIVQQPETTVYTVQSDDEILNLMSSDFRFVNCEVETGTLKLNFLGIDEYVMESFIISDYVKSTGEMDYIIAENSAFAIGSVVRDGYFDYVIAPNNSNETDEIENNSGEILPAHVLFDLVDPVFYQNNPDDLSWFANLLRKRLNIADCEYTISMENYPDVKLVATTENTVSEIIVNEKAVTFDTERETIFICDDFELYYDETGFHIFVINVYPPAYVWVYLTANFDSAEVTEKEIGWLKKVFESTKYDYSITVDSKLVTLYADADNSHLIIEVNKTTQAVGDVITFAENNAFALIHDDFGFGIIVK